MNIQEIHHSVSGVLGLAQQSIVTNTTTAGTEVDMLGFRALEFFIFSGTITDGAYAVSIEHTDTTGSGYTTVAAAEILGNADFALADDNVIKRLGYIGKKRFVRLSITSTGVTAGGVFNGGIAVKASAKTQPIAD